MRKLLDTSVNVGIGVDGTASSDCGHLLQEVRLALLLQRASGSARGRVSSDPCNFQTCQLCGEDHTLY